MGRGLVGGGGVSLAASASGSGDGKGCFFCCILKGVSKQKRGMGGVRVGVKGHPCPVTPKIAILGYFPLIVWGFC